MGATKGSAWGRHHSPSSKGGKIKRGRPAAVWSRTLFQEKPGKGPSHRPAAPRRQGKIAKTEICSPDIVQLMKEEISAVGKVHPITPTTKGKSQPFETFKVRETAGYIRCRRRKKLLWSERSGRSVQGGGGTHTELVAGFVQEIARGGSQGQARATNSKGGTETQSPKVRDVTKHGVKAEKKKRDTTAYNEDGGAFK